MTAVAAFQLTAATTQAAAPFMIGHAFKRGDVPVGQYLAIDLPNFSIVPLRTWNDGSLKHCAIIGRTPLTANVARQVNITRSASASPAGTPLTAASIAAAAPTASVQCGAYGTANLANLLASPKRTHISTKEMVECHYAAKVGTDASLYVTFHVRLYADGLMWVRAIVGNGYLNGTEKVRKDYIPTVTIGGVVVYNNGGATYIHSYTQRYDVTGWIGANPGVIPRHDTGYLNRTMLVPNYWKVGPTQAAIDAWIPFGNYTPGSNLNFTVGMGQGGAQNQIGLLPKWDAMYFTSQGHPTLFKAVVAHASAINSYGICYADTNTLDPARISDFPTWSYQGPGGSGQNDFATLKQDGVTQLGWEPAHFPSAGYLAYLLTADYYFIESSAYNALAVYLIPSSATGSGTARRIQGQNRGRAWAYRSISQVAAFYPDSAQSVFGDYKTWITTVFGQKKAQYVDGSTATSMWIGYEDFYSNRLYNSGSIAPNGTLCASNAPWEHHFNTSAVGHAYDLEPCDATGMANLLAFRNFVDAAPVWITGGTSLTEFNFGSANTYTVNIRTSRATTDVSNQVPVTDLIASDPGVIYKDTFSTSTTSVSNITTNTLNYDPVSGMPTNPTGYFGNLLPALAAAVDHGKAGAQASFNRFLNADNFVDLNVTANFANEPMWGIVPRNYVQPALLFTAVDVTAIVPTAGPSFVWDSLPLIPGAFVWDTYRGLGIPASDIPTGFNPPALLLNDVDSADPAGTEYRMDLAVPAGVTVNIGNRSDYEAFGPDGTYPTTQTVYKNGAGDTGAALIQIGTPSSTVSGVTVNPATATGSTTFTATVNGTGGPSPAVTWSRNGTAGTIDATTGAFIAPAATGSVQIITITATSVQDGTKSGSATATIAAAASTVSGVAVTPGTAAGAQNFSATVAGSFSPSQAVVWSSTAGTINSSGVFSPPPATTSVQSITVRATSVQDPTKSGTAIVTIGAIVVLPGSVVTSVSVTPTAANGATTFAATVLGSNSPSQAVTWSTTAGGISNAGVFAPPQQTFAAQMVTVTAISVQDPTKYATATVTIAAAAVPPASVVTGVAVLPTAINLGSGETEQFVAAVQGTNFPLQAVVWSVTGSGSITQSGLYTAPPSLGVLQYPIVVATSVQDPTKFGTTQVTVAANAPTQVAGTNLVGTAYISGGDGHGDNFTPLTVGTPGPRSASRTFVCTDPQTTPDTSNGVGTFFDMSNPAKPKGVKDPGATIDINFDWSKWLLDDGDGYASHKIVVSNGLQLVSTNQQAGVITGFVKGGTLNKLAKVTCHVVTNSTPPRVDERTIFLRIKDR